MTLDGVGAAPKAREKTVPPLSFNIVTVLVKTLFQIRKWILSYSRRPGLAVIGHDSVTCRGSTSYPP